MQPDSLHTKLKNAVRIDQALKFVWQASPLYSIFSCFIVITLGILPLLSLYLIKLIIDSVSGVSAGSGPEFYSTEFSKTLTYIILACAIGLITAFLNFVGDYIKKAQSHTVTDHMFSILHEKSMKIDLAYYESPSYRDTLFRAQREGPYRPTNIVNGLFAAGQSGASFLAVFGLLFMFHPALAAVMIAASLPGVILRLKYSEKIYHWQKKRTEDERRSYYFHWMLTQDSHAKEFKLFELNKYFIKQFKAIRQTLKEEKLYFEKRRALGDFITQACMTLAVFGSFAYITLKTIHGTISLGDMVMYFQAFQKGLRYLKTLLESGAQMYEDNLFLSHVYDFLKLKPRIVEPEHPVKVPEIIKTGIEFKNVKFSYPNNKADIINNIDFSIKPGEVVALVGPNGSGKSTIVKLLSRLYDPKKGSIKLDGQNIRDFKISDYKKVVSAVFQDHIKYQLSAEENIYLGNLEQKDDMDKITGAAQKAGVDKKISSLPYEYKTILGRWFKNGEELSTGQWQMMAIARAFFRNTPVIILDEPSSALDPQAEMDIFTRLKELIKDRAALVISHRYSTVRMADKILVLEKGKIVEQGTHEELIRTDSTYAKLYRTQADNYRDKDI